MKWSLRSFYVAINVVIYDPLSHSWVLIRISDAWCCCNYLQSTITCRGSNIQSEHLHNLLVSWIVVFLIGVPLFSVADVNHSGSIERKDFDQAVDVRLKQLLHSHKPIVNVCFCINHTKYNNKRCTNLLFECTYSHDGHTHKLRNMYLVISMYFGIHVIHTS